MRNLTYSIIAVMMLAGYSQPQPHTHGISIDIQPLIAQEVTEDLISEKPPQTSEKIIPLVAEKPDPEPLVAEKPKQKLELVVQEVVTSPPIKADKPIHDYRGTIDLINEHISSGGQRAYMDPPHLLLKHVRDHDNIDGVRNYPDAVLNRLTYQQLQWLHGKMHKDGDTFDEHQVEPFPAKEKVKVVNSDNRIIYVGAKWCGPCRSFKNTGALDALEDLGWKVNNTENSDLQVIDTDDDEGEYKRLFPNGVGGIPSMYIMKNGKIDKSSRIHPNTLLTNKKLGDKFTDWVKKKGNIYGWE